MERDATTILLACLSYASEATKTKRLAGVSAEEWRAVAELAGQHNVAPLFFHRTLRMNIVLPGDIKEKLVRAYRQDTLRTMRLYEKLSKLLQRLQEQDIPVIALKGIYLAEAVYEKIGLRAMRDIDLLVKKDNLPRVDAILLALGCAPEDNIRVVTEDNLHFRYHFPDDALMVEIHWSIIDAIFPFQIDMEELWRRARSVTLAQAPAWTFDPEDLLLHLCLHTAKHANEMNIRMLCDINEVVRRFGMELDWQEMDERARQWNAVRAVYLILRLAQELLDVPVPADWLVSLRPEDFSESYLDLAREQILGRYSDMKTSQLESNYLLNLLQLWGPKGLGNKLALIRERLLPPRETMARWYPAPVNSWRIYLYYPVRIMDILVKHRATLWQLARGNPKARAIAEHTNQVIELRDWLMSG